VRSPRYTAAVLAAGSLLLGACGGGGGGASGGDEPKGPADITVTAKEFRFDPAELTIDAGKPVVVAVQNIGSIPHDLTVKDKFKLTVANDRTGQKTLMVAKAGSYEFYCSLPGHKSAGMHGTLTVR
jgi:uncharacterized cupredoxin-like copper-binding protein